MRQAQQISRATLASECQIRFVHQIYIGFNAANGFYTRDHIDKRCNGNNRLAKIIGKGSTGWEVVCVCVRVYVVVLPKCRRWIGLGRTQQIVGITHKNSGHFNFISYIHVGRHAANGF